MAFKSKLRMEHIDDTEKYKLISDLVYVTWEKERIYVPKDFESDGHSIPKLLRSFAGSPFATKYPKSAWYHDWLCKMTKLELITRKYADSEYSHALKDEGATTFQRKRNYIGVRIGAWFGSLWRKK